MRVSVILPVYNAERYLALALASLLSQTHRDIEIVAIDDGSTDGSLRLLEAAADLDRRVRIWSRANRGLIATLNEGLAQADAEFVARMDADDIAFPGRFAAQLSVFAARPRLGLLGTNFTTLFQPDRVAQAAPSILTGPGERAVLGRFCTALRHPTIMLRRSAIPHGQLTYDADYPHAEDFDLFRRLALVTEIAETPEPLLAYRLHPESVSASRIDVMCATHLRILEENLTRHYPAAAGTGMERLGVTVDAGSVDAVAEMIRRLDAIAHRQPGSERAGFDIGVTNTVYFVFALLRRARAFDLARRFIDGARRREAIRRRERAVLATPLAGIGLSLSETHEGLRRYIKGVRLADSLPGHADILTLARRIEQTAQEDVSRHAC